MSMDDFKIIRDEVPAKKGSRIVLSSALALMATSIVIAVLVIAGEIHAPLKDWLKTVFTHHWVGKGVLGIATFTLVSVVGLAIPADREHRERHALQWSLWTVIISLVAMVGFIGFEALTH